MSRIYDQPDHPHYGPVRRLHIMLMQLFADRDFAESEREYRHYTGWDWDERLAYLLHWEVREAFAQRTILSRFLTYCS